jgi:hypothetical protein
MMIWEGHKAGRHNVFRGTTSIFSWIRLGKNNRISVYFIERNLIHYDIKQHYQYVSTRPKFG